MAVGWGALMAGVGLVVAADHPGRINLAIAIALFALAGFLAGVRSEERRILHALLGAVAGAIFYTVFVLLTWAVSFFGGPDRAGFVPGGRSDWEWHIGAFILAALIGGAIAAFRLRPQGDQRPRRRS
ncbi:MAG TPA: hypothetical protein PLV41_04935 [Miltoncostaeales bacterium]|jgi:hypothetical protein|nr:hypothetical protein [Miltoncostaeales bacterium]